MHNGKDNRIANFHPQKARCPIQGSLFKLQQSILGIARFSPDTLVAARLRWSDGSETDVVHAIGAMIKQLAALQSAIQNHEAVRSRLPADEGV